MYIKSESASSDVSQNNAFVKMLQDNEDKPVTFLQKSDHLTSCKTTSEDFARCLWSVSIFAATTLQFCPPLKLHKGPRGTV